MIAMATHFVTIMTYRYHRSITQSRVLPGARNLHCRKPVSDEADGDNRRC